jgi:hypothetical protein
MVHVICVWCLTAGKLALAAVYSPVALCVRLFRCPSTRLDKKKFFVVGLGLFSGVTTVLYPLSVVKTRQMAAHRDVAAGLSGTKQVARSIWAQEGVR